MNVAALTGDGDLDLDEECLEKRIPGDKVACVNDNADDCVH